MRVTAIIQARMGSTRLPGKVLYPLHGTSVLGHVITRLKQARLLDDIVVATSNLAADNAIAAEAHHFGCPVARGSEENVLARYYQAITSFPADAAVRITADCPLLDAGLLDQMVESFLKLRESRPEYQSLAYLSNTLKRTFPRGLDIEILDTGALRTAYHEARDAVDQEHVTPFIWRHPDKFQLYSYTQERDDSLHRWTLDTPADWRFIQAVYNRLYPAKAQFTWHDVLSLVQTEPEIALLNKDVVQKELSR